MVTSVSSFLPLQIVMGKAIKMVQWILLMKHFGLCPMISLVKDGMFQGNYNICLIFNELEC